MWRTLMLFGLINLTGRSPMNVSLPWLVKDSLRADVQTLGLLYSIFSIGSVMGAIWTGRKTSLRSRGLTIYGMLTLVGLLTCALGLPISRIGVMSALLILGLTLAIANLTWANLLQESMPRELFGRVSSINSLGVRPGYRLQPDGSHGASSQITEPVVVRLKSV